MEPTEVKLSYGITVNTNDYESERFEMSVIVALGPNESTDDAYDTLLPYLKEKCRQAYWEAKNHPMRTTNPI